MEYESDIDYYTRADIYSYGMVLAYCLTATLPWGVGMNTDVVLHAGKWDPDVAKVKIPTRLAENDQLRRLINHCYAKDARDRPNSAKEVVKRYFTGKL